MDPLHFWIFMLSFNYYYYYLSPFLSWNYFQYTRFEILHAIHQVFLQEWTWTYFRKSFTDWPPILIWLENLSKLSGLLVSQYSFRSDKLNCFFFILSVSLQSVRIFRRYIEIFSIVRIVVSLLDIVASIFYLKWCALK